MSQKIALLSFIGYNDPFGKTGSDGPLLAIVKYLMRQNKPLKKVHILYTPDMDFKAAKTAIEKIDKIDVTEDPIALNDPLAQSEIKDHILKAYQRLKDEGYHIYLNGSSGTPAMKTCSHSMIVAGMMHAEIFESRPEDKRNPEQDLVFQTDLGFLEEEFLRNKLKTLVQKRQYQAASGFLKAAEPVLAHSAGLLSTNRETLELLLAYGHAFGSFDLAQAQEHLSNLLKRSPNLADDLQAQQNLLGNLTSTPTQPAAIQARECSRLIALYWNLQLKADNHEWVDYLGRLYRLWEALSEYAARWIYQDLGFKVGYDDTGTLDRKAIVDFLRERPLIHYSEKKISDKLIEYQEIYPRAKLENLLHYVTGGSDIKNFRFSRINWVRLIGYACYELKNHSSIDHYRRIKKLINHDLIVGTLLNQTRNQTIIAHGYGGLSDLNAVKAGKNTVNDVNQILNELFQQLDITRGTSPFDGIEAAINKQLGLTMPGAS